MIRDDEYRLNAIRRIGGELTRYIKESGLNEEALATNQIAQWTVTTPLYNIGEHVNCISTELKEAHPEIPWLKIAGMRHRLVHDYEDTNWSIVAKTILEDVPEFLEQLENL